jgi:hypothetical protein
LARSVTMGVGGERNTASSLAQGSRSALERHLSHNCDIELGLFFRLGLGLGL